MYFLYYHILGAGPKDGEVTEEIITASGKMVILDRLLTKLTDKGHRVVIFSQFTKSLDMWDYFVCKIVRSCWFVINVQ